MSGGEQTEAALEWRDGGVPVSTRFDDPYFSLADGLAETRHVFLAGNDLPARFAPGFAIAELGFGTGLNLLATLIAARGQAGPIHYTSFEAFPLTVTQIAQALQAFPEARAVADPFLAEWAAGKTHFALGPLDVQVILGDARDRLPAWGGRADAWYLDGFSPAKNPELWSGDMMGQVSAHTVTGGTFATYTAAGHVRRALATAGFMVERRQGHGRKRHMTVGTKP